MKPIITVLIFAVAWCNDTFGQKDIDILKLSELQAFYNNNDTVSLIVQNVSDSKYFFLIALERENGSGWVEVLDDIHRESAANNKNVVTIYPNQKRVIAWVPSELFCQFCPGRKSQLKGKYRLAVKYGKHVTNIGSLAFTSSFILK